MSVYFLGALAAYVCIGLLLSIPLCIIAKVAPIPPQFETGVASWYGERERGLPMANGEPFDPDAMTCATWDWPLGSVLSVSVPNRPAITVTVTDRGPAKRLHRAIDLSRKAFSCLAPLKVGLIHVEIELLKEGGK